MKTLKNDYQKFQDFKKCKINFSSQTLKTLRIESLIFFQNKLL